MKEINSSFAYQKYQKLCETHNLTSYMVAKKSEGKISTAVLTQWKYGEYQLKLEKLQIIADVFGVPVKEFIE